MNLWRVLWIGALVAAFFLVGAAVGGTSMLEVLAGLNAAIGMGIIALLAVISEKISKPK